MSSAGELAYHLRPNKAVEREIMLSMLAALSPRVPVSDYRYIGLGGAFLEDFRLLHSRLGLQDMVCVESNPEVYLRQVFNKPLNYLTLVEDSLENYLAGAVLDEVPSIVWLDYTAAKGLRGQIESFCNLVADVAPRSIVKITLNAKPGNLGTPSVRKKDGNPERLSGDGLLSHRLKVLKSRVGNEWWPSDAALDELTNERFGGLLARICLRAVNLEMKGRGITFKVLCSFIYSDGQPMLTITGVSLDEDDVEDFLDETRMLQWEFYNGAASSPVVIDLPVLSTLERLTMQKQAGRTTGAPKFIVPPGRILDESGVKECYRQFYRLIPQFSKVDI